MRIAMLGPIAWRTPPEHYGPWERVTSLLTEGLVRRGIEVTLFATADSVTSARLEAISPHGYAEDESMDGRVWEALHVAHALALSGDFDLVHNQLDWLPLAFDASWHAPMVTTIHGFSGPGILPAYARARSALVSISDADRSPDLDYVATVHHGIDLSEFDDLPPAGDDLVVFGRIHPDKGIADAIAIARAAGRRLVICGIVQDAAYFAREVQPHIDGASVVYLGSVGPAERTRVLGGAAVLLHPIAFDEPFGLSVVEAMVCGTPVVAYRRGSMPEVIDDGVTGFVVSGRPEAVAAVPRAAGLDRRSVRARARERFDVERMVDDYLRVYRGVLERSPFVKSPEGSPLRWSNDPGTKHRRPPSADR
ncbi:glycosyltransferase family 4 protein [Microbacterium sp. 4R-513]|uniref:glycosyltransferase family 4 protein n=1 Tax=Microbacterium sp. 4R-513 TaxID=2567934 RepID=UPI0013E187AC|nr:glycosyltransferase family 4 protein [Microbacterium sp. 4R-513]QIG40196.1 glycosyltransferase family 4 protein [Microbacterium sp. 4R-513]